MMNGYTEDRQYGVNIMENGGGGFIACAVICDKSSYGGDRFWFGMGHFKTLKGAQKSAIRQMAELGKKIKFEEVQNV